MIPGGSVGAHMADHFRMSVSAPGFGWSWDGTNWILAHAGTTRITVNGTTGLVTIVNNLDVQGSTTLVATTTSGVTIFGVTNTEAVLIRKAADGGDLVAFDTTNNNILLTASDITWASGKAVTAASYAIQRDADGTNQLHFNTPTGATFEFSVNDVASLIVGATGTLNSGNATSSTITLQNQTFTAGATHNAVVINPTWAAENFEHNALSINATQNGANTNALRGIEISMIKATGVSVLGTMTGIAIEAPTVTGTVTASYAIDIASQTNANITTPRAIRTQSGIANAWLLASGGIIYTNAADTIRIMGITNIGGLAISGLDSGQVNINTAEGSDFLFLQSYTFVSGIDSPFQVNPIFSEGDTAHVGIDISATQNGANTTSIRGLRTRMTKATGATILATMIGYLVGAPTVTGTVTNNYGIDIENQSPVGGTTAYGIRVQSQTANATTTRAIEIVGTGVNNAIRLGASPNIYSSAAENIRFTDSTNANGLDLNLLATAVQTIRTISATTGSIALQTNTFTAGATHNAVIIDPTWVAEDQSHRALAIAPTQNGANSLSLLGINITMTKATGATVLATMTGIAVVAPVVTGTVTTSYAINIASQTNANITTPRGIRFAATGVANSVVWGNSALQYANAAENIRVADSTNANGLDFNLLATANQTINTISATTGSIVLQNQTFTAGATHNTVQITPTWATENNEHYGLYVTGTQNGANATTMTGVRVVMTKATGATVLGTMSGLIIGAPTITGTVTLNAAIEIGSQTNAGATTSRAIIIYGADSSNSIAWGNNVLQYAPALGTVRFADSTAARGIDFLPTAASDQIIRTTAGNLQIGVAGAQQLQLSSTDFRSISNDGLTLGVSGTAWGDLFLADGGVINWNAGDITITHATNALTFAGGNYTLTQAVATTGSPAAITVTGGAHTTLTAGTEATDINFNLARTVQFDTGALSTQRAFRIARPTYGFVAASTITNAVTMNITGMPLEGTNATITNSYGLLIGLTTGTTVSGAGVAAGAQIVSPGISNGIGAVTTRVGLEIGDNFDGTSVSLGNQTSTLSNFTGLLVSSISLTSTTLVRTVSDAMGANIAPPTSASSNVEIDILTALNMSSNVTWYQSSASSAFDTLFSGDFTLTLGKTTQLTNVTPAIVNGDFRVITVNQSAGATIVNNVANVYIEGAFTAGASVTLTNNYALWVDAGISRFDGNIELQSTVTTYGNVATAGRGIAAILASGQQLAVGTDGTTVATYTAGAADELVEIGGFVEITAYTSGNGALAMDYTTGAGTVVTGHNLFGRTGTNALANSLAATGHIRIKPNIIAINASSTVTLKTSTGAGTMTGSWYAYIKRIQ